MKPAIFLLIAVILLSGCTNLSPAFAGKVNGQPVKQESYNATARQKFESYHIKNGASPDEATMKQLREEAWQDIVRDVVLQQLYRKYNITVTSAEVMDSLRNHIPDVVTEFPVFQTDGVFDRSKYLTSLETGKPANLEWLKNRYYVGYIPYRKLETLIGSQAPIDEKAIRTEYRYRYSQADVRLVTFPASSFPVPPASSAEVQQYYQTHQSEFAEEATCDLDYVTLPYQPSSTDLRRAEKKIDSLWSVLLRGGNFETLVRKYSTSRTAIENGDIGFIQVSDLPDSIVQQLDNPQSPGFTSPIRIPEGWRILQMVSRTRSMMKLRELVVVPEISKATQTALQDKANEIRELAVGMGLANAAHEYDLECGHARNLSAKTREIPELGKSSSLIARALRASNGELFEPLTNSRVNGLVLIHVTRVQSNTVRPLVECADSINTMLTRSQQMEMSRATATEWGKRFTGAAIYVAAEQAGYPIIDIPGMSANSPVNSAISDSLNRIVLGSEFIGLYSEPLPTKDGWSLASVSARHDPITPTFETAKPVLENAIRQRKSSAYFQQWLNDRVRHARVKRYERPVEEKPISVKQMPLSEDAFNQK
jgi:hypothetical protein